MARSVHIGHDANEERLNLTPEGRSTHLHIIGASGKGKSRQLTNLITQDIKHGHGVCVIDPHGSLYEDLRDFCAYHGVGTYRQVHLFDPNETDWTVGFNPLRRDPRVDLSYIVDNAVAACAQVWEEDSSKTPLLRKCLRAVFYALAENDQTLADARRLIAIHDKDGFREQLTKELSNNIFEQVWDDLNSLKTREFAETFSSTDNRLIEFLASPILQRMFSAKDNALDLRTCMDEGHVVLVNLQPLQISPSNARVIGTLLTNNLFALARQRDKTIAARHPFYLYIDECYQFLTEDIEAMLDQSRKMGLHVTLAHQRLGQLMRYGEHIYNAVMTNAQTKLVFGGITDADAGILATELLRETFDYNRPKEIMMKPVTVDHEVVHLPSFSVTEMHSQTTVHSRSSMSASSRSEMESIGSMSGFSSGTSIGSGSSTGVSQGFVDAGMIGPTALPVETHIDSDNLSQASLSGTSSGHSRSSGRGHSTTVAEGNAVAYGESVGTAITRGLAPTLRPVLEERPTQLEGADEIMHRAILKLRKLPKRCFVFTGPDRYPSMGLTPDVPDTPMLPSMRARFEERVRNKSIFTIESCRLIGAGESDPDEPMSDPDDFFE